MYVYSIPDEKSTNRAPHRAVRPRPARQLRLSPSARPNRQRHTRPFIAPPPFIIPRGARASARRVPRPKRLFSLDLNGLAEHEHRDGGGALADKQVARFRRACRRPQRLRVAHRREALCVGDVHVSVAPARVALFRGVTRLLGAPEVRRVRAAAALPVKERERVARAGLAAGEGELKVWAKI